MKWPRSKFFQLLIALLGATIAAALAFRLTFDATMAAYVREYPHDGQDSLGAFVDAVFAWGAVEIGGSVGLYFLQRRFTKGLPYSSPWFK